MNGRAAVLNGVEPSTTKVEFPVVLAAIVLAWLMVALMEATQTAMSQRYNGQPWEVISIYYPLVDGLLNALLTMVLLAISKCFPLDRMSWSDVLFVVAPAVIFLALFRSAADAALYPLVGKTYRGIPHLALFEQLLFRRFAWTVIMYWMVLGILHAAYLYDRDREHQMRASQLEARLSKAQLDVLRTQLRPHFLFNTLHTISALVYRDTAMADRMISRLAELLRASVETTGIHQITVREEIDLLKRYLEIEEIRFPDRLSVAIDVDPQASEALVPTFLLQPLVENAIKHGVETCEHGGRVIVTIRVAGPDLKISVWNTSEHPLPGTIKPGIGVQNTKQRLRQLFGSSQSFSLSEAEGGGIIASIRLPFTT